MADFFNHKTQRKMNENEIEEMKSFFDLRVNGYDDVMVSTVEEYKNFYSKIASSFKKTDDPVEVLDLGAGTGIENVISPFNGGKKIALYKKLRQALTKKGLYIEGDYIVTLDEEKRLLKEFRQQTKNNTPLEDGQYHIDIPFSEVTQIQTLRDAGFKDINIIFRTSRSNVVIAK